MDKNLKALAEKKWRDFASLNSAKKEQSLKHDFVLRIEGTGGYDETIRFIIDDKEVITCGGGYLGPDGDSFVELVTHMKTTDNLEVGWSYEPGECNLLFSRRKDLVYFCKLGEKNGFFLRYSYFVECITEGAKSRSE